MSQDRCEESRSLIAKDTFNRPVLDLRVGSQLRFQGSPLLVPVSLADLDPEYE